MDDKNNITFHDTELFQNVHGFLKDVESRDTYKKPVEKRVQDSKLTPIIKNLSNEELKSLFTILQNKDAIKAMEHLQSGRYAEIQIYIIGKEILDRATIVKIEDKELVIDLIEDDVETYELFSEKPKQFSIDEIRAVFCKTYDINHADLLREYNSLKLESYTQALRDFDLIKDGE